MAAKFARNTRNTTQETRADQAVPGFPQQVLDTGEFVLDAGQSASGLPQFNSVNGGVVTIPADKEDAGFSLVDLPAVGLQGSTLAAVTVTMQFQTYLMCQPPGANSIWVTLREMDWQWNGTTNLVNGTWGPVTSTDPPFTAKPIGKDTTVLPQWSSFVTNYQ